MPSERTSHAPSSIHQALDGLDELLERKGLRQEHEVLTLREIACERVVGVAGDKNNLGVQSAFAQFSQHRRTVHFRHDDVRNDEVDRLACGLDDAQGVKTGLRLEHRIAARGESACGESAHRLLVFDQQDRAPAGQIRSRLDNIRFDRLVDLIA